MAYFPLFINLKDKSVLVVGCTDSVAYQVSTLISFGALVSVYSSALTPELEKLEKTTPEQLTLCKQDLTKDDFASLSIKPIFVICASSDSSLNQAAYDFFHSQNIPVEDVTELSRCDFLFPAVIRQSDVVCGVSSSGKSAHVAHFVKGLLETTVPPSMGAINDRMEEIREMVKLSMPDSTKRSEALKVIFSRLIEEDNQTSDSDIDAMLAQYGM